MTDDAKEEVHHCELFSLAPPQKKKIIIIKFLWIAWFFSSFFLSLGKSQAEKRFRLISTVTKFDNKKNDNLESQNLLKGHHFLNELRQESLILCDLSVL